MNQVDEWTLKHAHQALVRRGRRRLGPSDAEDLASEAIERSLRRPAPDVEDTFLQAERVLRPVDRSQFRRPLKAPRGGRVNATATEL